MQRLNIRVKMWQTMLSMFLASIAALLISTAPAYADTDSKIGAGPAAPAPIEQVVDSSVDLDDDIDALIEEAVKSESTVKPDAEAPVPEAASEGEATPSGEAVPVVAETLTRTDEAGVVTTCTAENGVYTINESGNYTLTGTGTNAVSIVGQIKVVLQLIDAHIDAGKNYAAIDISDKADVSIVVQGDCSVSGSNGISVHNGATLDLSGATGKSGSDTLTATAQAASHGCGIGYYDKGGADAGNITIHGIASVTATGSGSDEGGVGIGGGRRTDESQGKVVIRNVGSVIAAGGGKSAAIGAGFWNAADVAIGNCDSVIANGGKTAAGIGSSRNAGRENNQANSVYDTNIVIYNSNVIAQGGYEGAGIGSGYQDLCVQDSSRPEGAKAGGKLAAVRIAILGNSRVNATGGTLAAGIGGGYKGVCPDIFIGSGSTVTAYAGAKESGGSKVPEAIGSGADGSSIYSDSGSRIVIETGATVQAFGYGYEAADRNRTDNKGVLGSKWALTREANSTGSTSVMVLRMLDRDFYNEGIEGMGFFGVSGGTLVFHNVATGEETRVDVRPGFTSMAITLASGTYTVFVDGAENALFSFLADEGYSARADGSQTGLGVHLVYGNEALGSESTGSYADYTYAYKTNGNSDVVTVHYAFGAYDAGFTMGNGVEFFDAVAIRPGAPITVPQDPAPAPAPAPGSTPSPSPGPAPAPAPAPAPEPDPTPIPAPTFFSTPEPAPVSIPADPAPAPANGAAPTTAASTSEAVSGAETPLASTEGVAEDGTPLSGIFDDGEDCWVHWWIMLGILLTSAYSSVVIARRKKHSHDVFSIDKDVRGDGDRERVSVPSANLGAQPAMSVSTEA